MKCTMSFMVFTIVMFFDSHQMKGNTDFNSLSSSFLVSGDQNFSFRQACSWRFQSNSHELLLLAHTRRDVLLHLATRWLQRECLLLGVSVLVVNRVDVFTDPINDALGDALGDGTVRLGPVS